MSERVTLSLVKKNDASRNTCMLFPCQSIYISNGTLPCECTNVKVWALSMGRVTVFPHFWCAISKIGFLPHAAKKGLLHTTSSVLSKVAALVIYSGLAYFTVRFFNLHFDSQWVLTSKTGRPSQIL